MNLPIYVVDWETYYDTNYSLSKLSMEEYIRSPQFEPIGCSIWAPGEAYPRWFADDLQLYAYLSTLPWSELALLAHHNQFDGTILSWLWGFVPKLYLCSMAMAQPFYGFTTGVGLGSLMRELGIGDKGDEVIHARGKHKKDFTAQELANYGRYCCNDNWGSMQIFHKLIPQTNTKELLLIDECIRCFTQPRIKLNLPALKEHYNQVVDLKQANYIWAGNLLGVSEQEVKTTIMSNEKMATVLRELGVDPPTKISPTTGLDTFAFAKTDDEFLELKNHENEAVQLLVTCRLGGKSTLAETRALRLINAAPRGLLPIYLKYYAAHPGRYGGGDMINPQNFPRSGALKDSMEAEEEHVFVEGDLSQIEARLLVVLAEQQDVVDVFRNYDAGTGPDVYCTTATAFLGRPITPENKKERQLGKVIRLALGYGMGVPKFMVTAKRDGVILTGNQAEAVHKWYRNTSGAVTRFWRQGDTALRKLIAGEQYQFGVNGCIVVQADGIHLPSGRVLRYAGLHQDGVDEYGRPVYKYYNRKKKVKIHGPKTIENICQSLAGSVNNDAWLRLRGRMKIVLQVHDSLMGVVHQDNAEWGARAMGEALTAPVKWLPGLPVACEVGYARTYGGIKKQRFVR